MHISHSELVKISPVIEVSLPHKGEQSGATFGPNVEVWPLGKDSPEAVRHYWSLDIDEAEQLGRELLDAAARGRELFPGR